MHKSKEQHKDTALPRKKQKAFSSMFGGVFLRKRNGGGKNQKNNHVFLSKTSQIPLLAALYMTHKHIFAQKLVTSLGPCTSSCSLEYTRKQGSQASFTNATSHKLLLLCTWCWIFLWFATAYGTQISNLLCTVLHTAQCSLRKAVLPSRVYECIDQHHR